LVAPLGAALLACAPHAPRARIASAAHGTVVQDERTIRVALALDARRPALSATGDWRLYGRRGRGVLVRGGADERWTIERRGAQLRAVAEDGTATAWRDGPLVARPVDGDAVLSLNGRGYRGELRIGAGERGLVIVNALPVEQYLRGVVPLEMGERSLGDEAAVQAQAVAARSYAYVRLGDAGARFDVVATVTDQVYGGADVERPFADDAVAATAGQVLLYGGRVVNAPYHSTCGGSTAEPTEVWYRTPGEPYLQRVSDQIPGTDRYYCDISPRFTWTRTFDRGTLRAALARYLRDYASVRGDRVGAVRGVAVEALTESGRVATLGIDTDRAHYALRGNDIRFVLRPPGGEILNSTYFTVESAAGEDGRLATLTLRGRGYGHGIGMCQWGAIGRARAGQDYRTILQTYYPGTVVGTVD
jgi:stage II sporulation protein D